MNNEDIEILSQYIDREVDRAQAMAIKERMNNDEEFRQTYQRLTMANNQFATAVAAIDDEPLSPKLEALLAERLGNRSDAAEPNTVKTNDSGLGLWQGVLGALDQFIQQMTWARAGLAAMAPIAVAAVLFVQGNPSQTAGTTPELLAQQLDDMKTGETRVVNQTRMTQTMAFYRKDDVLCKRYVSESANKNRDVIACRENGNWNTVAQASAAPAESTGNVYVPASADRDTTLDAYIEQNMQGIPLTIKQEREVLHSLSQ